MDFSASIRGFAGRLTPPQRRIYNLSGSSLALFLALHEGPYLMVERTEEEARRLWQDILFFRGLIPPVGGLRCLFVPGPNGPGAAGERALASWRLFSGGERGSLITSREALPASLWSGEALRGGILGLQVRGEVAGLHFSAP